MMRARTKLFALVLLAAPAGFAPRAQAASCTVTATAMAFGTYDPISPTPRDSAASVAASSSRSVVFDR